MEILKHLRDFVHVSAYIGFVVIVFGLYKWTYLNKSEKYVMLVMSLNLLADIIAGVMRNYSIPNTANATLYNLLTATELSVIIYLYGSATELRNTYLGKHYKKFLVLYIFVFSSNFIFNQGPFVLNTYTYLPMSIVAGIISFAYLRKVTDEDTSPRLLENLLFWYSVANLIYYICHIPFVSVQHPPFGFSILVKTTLKNINTIMYSAWFIIIGIGFLWKKKVPLYI
jgi:hypothetical protein